MKRDLPQIRVPATRGTAVFGALAVADGSGAALDVAAAVGAGALDVVLSVGEADALATGGAAGAGGVGSEQAQPDKDAAARRNKRRSGG